MVACKAEENNGILEFVCRFDSLRKQQQQQKTVSLQFAVCSGSNGYTFQDRAAASF